MTRYTGTWPLVRVALRRDRVIAELSRSENTETRAVADLMRRL